MLANLSRECHEALLTRRVPKLHRDLSRRSARIRCLAADTGGGTERVLERRAVALISILTQTRARGSSRRLGERERLDGVVEAHSARERRVKLASAEALHRRRLPHSAVADHYHLWRSITLGSY